VLGIILLADDCSAHSYQSDIAGSCISVKSLQAGRVLNVAAAADVVPQVMNYFHVAEHMRGIWMANVSNYLLSFTYAKVRSTMIVL
jgi:hypothetical protein